MFSGSSSPPKEKGIPVPQPKVDSTALDVTTESSSAPVRDKKFSPPASLFRRRSSDDDKKRWSTKAASFFSNAKNSLSLSSLSESPSDGPTAQPAETLLQKLGRMDPALTVPQGSLNNSAGESLPTARSSFRVGVTEDRNRKCRRTMEDTHSYLYNFLGTPAPATYTGSSMPAENEWTDDADRSSNAEETTNIVETDNGYFAVFDGHAGTFAAEWCGKKLHLILEEVMRNNPNTPVPELLDQTFTRVDQQLGALPLKNSGCTAVIAVLRWEDRVPSSLSATGSAALAAAAATASKSDSAEESGNSLAQQTVSPSILPKLQNQAVRQRVLYTANVGDARIVLCRNGRALRLSYDHKGSDENEGKRIANAGGLILNNRVNGVLAVTRALGDAYLKDLVTGHPYTTETVLQPEADEFMILACDGLWDVCTDQEAVDLIRNIQDAQEASKVLVDHALASFSTDNLSCMVIRFDANRVKEVVDRRIDLIGVDGDPSMKVKNGLSETDKIVEGARKHMADSGLIDDSEDAEMRRKEILEEITKESLDFNSPVEQENAVLTELAQPANAPKAGPE